jgi:hypothetical protein
VRWKTGIEHAIQDGWIEDGTFHTTKGNVVLYLDKELVTKSKELCFNLGKKRKRKS